MWRPGLMTQHASETGGIDWGAVGTAIVALASGIAGAIGLRRKLAGDGEKKAAPPPVAAIVAAADEDDRALAVLRAIIVTLQDDGERQRAENARLWERNRLQDERYATLETRCAGYETSIREIRGQAADLRQKLIKAGIDPGA